MADATRVLERVAPPATDLAHMRVADAAEYLTALEPEDAADRLAVLSPEQAAEIFDQPGFEHCDVLEQLPPDFAVALLDRMSNDRAAEIFRRLPAPVAATLRPRLDAETRAGLERILSYPPGTAGSIMTTEYLFAPSDETVDQVLARVRSCAGAVETVYAIYLLKPGTNELDGVLSLRDLVVSMPDVRVGTLTHHRHALTVAPLAKRDEVATLISKYDLLAVPVVDVGGQVLGIVTVDDVIDAITQEATADTQKLGGSEALGAPYMKIGLGQMIRKRAGWLMALFLSEMLTATAMQHFEAELERAIVLTLFIPLIMSSGGNSGSQATSLIIRALALGEVRLRDWWRVALRELPTGMVLGAILGVIGVIRISVWQLLGFYNYGVHWQLIALTVGLGLTAIVMFGSMAGSLLPFVLQRLGFDPASASAPFVATLVDVTGLVIYFSVATVVLTGTIL